MSANSQGTQSVRFCPHCGASVGQTTAFCPACGAKLRDEESDGLQTRQPKQRKPHSARRRVILAAVVIIMLAIGGVVTYRLWTRNYVGTFSLTVLDKVSASNTSLLSVASDGKKMIVVGGGDSGEGAEVTGSISSRTVRDGKIIYGLETTAYDTNAFERSSSTFSGTPHYDPSYKVIVPEKATPEKPYGTWGFVLRARIPEVNSHSADPKCYDVQSKYLTIRENGTATLGEYNAETERDPNASADSINYADYSSSDFDAERAKGNSMGWEHELKWKRDSDGAIELIIPDQEDVVQEKVVFTMSNKPSKDPNTVESALRSGQPGPDI